MSFIGDPEETELRRYIEALEARAALAQPEPQGATAWMYLGEPNYDGSHWHDQWHVTLDEKLAKYKSGSKAPIPLWSRPAIEPVPVSERLPGPEDCDTEWRCWWWIVDQPGELPHWIYCTLEVLGWTNFTAWLPHHALPVPQQQEVK